MKYKIEVFENDVLLCTTDGEYIEHENIFGAVTKFVMELFKQIDENNDDEVYCEDMYHTIRLVVEHELKPTTYPLDDNVIYVGLSY